MFCGYIHRLVVVGGGYIGCEQASIFNNLGTEVYLIVRQVLLLLLPCMTHMVISLTNCKIVSYYMSWHIKRKVQNI